MSVYPAPSNIWKFYLPIPIIAMATLYLDKISQGYTNPIIFFAVTAGLPVLFGAIYSRAEGKSFLRMFGISASIKSMAGLALITGGATLIIVFLLNIPLSIMYAGTTWAAAFKIFYFPLSTHALATLTIIPTTYVVIYYITVASGEELFKFYGRQVCVNWFSKHKLLARIAPAKDIALVLGILVSWMGWIMMHAVNNPAIVSIPGMGMALLFSIIWMLPFYFFMEPLVDFSKGINWSVYSVSGAIAGHAVFDIVIEALNMNLISVAFTTTAISMGVASIIAGLGLLAYEYYRKGLPLFGVIKI